MVTINRLLKKIGDMRISNKMMLIYVVGGFIPLLLLSFYLIGFTRNLIIDQATTEAINNTTRLEERLQETFATAVNISDGIYLDQDLKRLVKTQYSDTETVIEDLMNYTTFIEYLRLYDDIDSIRFYVENASLLDNAQIMKTREKHRNANWYKTAVEMDGKIAFVYHFDEIKFAYQVAMVRLIKDNQGIKVGVLVINLNNVTLRKLVDNEPFDILGILNNERIFLASDIENEGLTLDDNREVERLLKLEGNINVYDSPQGSFKVIKNSFKAHGTENPIDLVTLIPMRKFLDAANRSIESSILFISISVLIAFIMVYILTRRLSDRIELFRTNMHKVATGNFDITIDDESDDEIGLLFEDLDLMSSSIKALIEEVYNESQQREQLSLRQKEVEFKMLTSQIDPHFLYNTLETIRMEAIINDQNNIATIVKKLAFIMRRKLSVSNEEVKLESELELLTHYLEIQTYRFGDRVSYHIENRCKDKTYQILPLLLQPIVENAFIHGLENKVGKGEIIIIIDDEGKYLNVKISDNGIGIKADVLDKLNKKMRNDVLSSRESIGMMNVYQRVQMFYGYPYTLEIVSEEGEGTTATFKLPKKNIESKGE
jgi:two-component system sensor histidine kinase YesM